MFERRAWTTLAVGLAGSALVGVARVEAGSHFPSDVLVGADVGTSFGLAVPALHTLNLQATALASPQTSGLAVTGASDGSLLRVAFGRRTRMAAAERPPVKKVCGRCRNGPSPSVVSLKPVQAEPAEAPRKSE